MQSALITLRSAHGRYLTCDTEGRIKADATVIGPWEQWTVVPVDETHVALKSDHGTYLTAARDDAARTPQARAIEIGPWEVWEVVQSEGVAFCGEHGGYLGAAPDTTVNCESLEAYSWQGWQSDPMDWWLAPPPNVVTATGLQGRLRIEHGAFVDDSGLVLPVFAHAGDLFSMYTRNQAFALQQLDDLVEAGYHGARIWFTLGCGRDALCPVNHFWAGRECGPNHTPNYWDVVGQFLLEMHKRGLRVVWSQGDPAQTGADINARKGYAQQVASVARQVDSTGFILAFYDAGNEAWQNDSDRFYHGVDGPKNMATVVNAFTAAGGTALTTTTSPPSEDPADMDLYTPHGVSLWDVHSYRGGHSWDKRRHIFTLPYENGGPKCSKVGIGSEPPGNGQLVSAQENRDELDDETMALLAAASFIGRTAHVWFSGEGVKLGYETPEGLKAMKGFSSVPQMQRLLPHDVMSYGSLHHSGDTWRGMRVFSLTDPNARMDGAISKDGHFAYTADGPAGSHTYICERAFEGQIITPGVISVVDDFSAKAGEHVTIEWKRGRVILGQVLSATRGVHTPETPEPHKRKK